MKKRNLILSLVLLVVFVFAGCGKVEQPIGQPVDTIPDESPSASFDEKTDAKEKTGVEGKTDAEGKTAADNDKADLLGIQLSATDITPTGLTLVCNQSGGQATGELFTGSMYWLEKKVNGEWVAVEMVQDNIGWDDMALLIQMDGSTEWTIDWDWIYGVLPAGSYRIGKEILDFRATGDYDTHTYYAEFEIM